MITIDMSTNKKYLDKKFIKKIKERTTLWYNKLRDEQKMPHERVIQIMINNLMLNASNYQFYRNEFDELIWEIESHIIKLRNCR